MKATKKISFVIQILAWTGFLLLGVITISQGQDAPKSEPASKPSSASKADTEYKIRVAVEEVRLDVVVLDKKGKQITNLLADDFQIFQEGVPQQVRSCSYVVDQTAVANQTGIAPKKTAKTLPPLSAKKMTRDQVRRVIAFVIDDLTLNFESVYYTRTALKKFVEKQMAPGDVVAIIRTSRGNSALQLFLSDKTQINARIDGIRWAQNIGYDGFDIRNNMYSFFDGQLSAVRYCIAALQNMPGRKAIVLMSNQTTIPSDMVYGANGNARTDLPVNYKNMYAKQYERMADDALRAGVVIHTMDMRALEASFPDNPDIQPEYDNVGRGGGMQGGGMRGGGMGGGQQGEQQQPLNPWGERGPGSWGRQVTSEDLLQRRLESRVPLSEKTGGLFLSDTNDFINGIEEVNEALKGYYILSYIPPAYTFRSDQKDRYRSVKVKVKIKGAEVHSRDGFYGEPQKVIDPNEVATVPMRDALFSPFEYSDVKVNLASGYMATPSEGYLVRSWLHLNYDDLTKTKTVIAGNDQPVTLKEGEGEFVVIYAVNVTSDVMGAVKDINYARYIFRIKEENIPMLKEQGLRFSLTLPIKKPGPYYVRVAVRDETSKKIGSAYQFIEVPDIKGGKLAMSNVFVLGGDDDISYIMTGAREKDAQNLLVPQLSREGRSPAVRTYRPGESISYMMLVYNAKHSDKDVPQLEYSAVLYKDGQEVSRSGIQPVPIRDAKISDQVPILGKVALMNYAEGDYIMQFVVTDKRLGSKNNSVAQSFDFRIAKAVTEGNIAQVN